MRFMALIVALVPTMALATSTVEGSWSVNRLKGGSQVATHTGATADEAWGKCIAAIPKSQATTTQTTGKNTYTCQTPRYVATETFSPNPAPPPPVNCVVSEWSALEPAVCPESGQQTRTRTIVTPPQNGGELCPELTETVPCTYVPPAPTETWTRCADENGLCSLPDVPRTVRYGADTRWDAKAVTASPVMCNNTTFTDVAFGTRKVCEYSSVIPDVPPPAPTGIANLSWTAPVANTDGTPLVTLAGYRVYYGRTADNMDQSVQIQNAAITSLVVGELASGSWFFTVRAYTSTGAESADSNIAQTIIP